MPETPTVGDPMTSSKKAYGPFQGSIVGRRVRRRNGGTWPPQGESGRILLAWLDRNDVWISVVVANGHSREVKLADVVLEEEPGGARVPGM